MLTNSLAQITDFKAKNPHSSSSDSDFHVRHVLSLQKIHSDRIVQLEAVERAFKAESPSITLQSEFNEVTLLLGDAVGELYSVVTDLLHRRISNLETEIIAAHISMEREEEERAIMGGVGQHQQLTADIRHLCTVLPAGASFSNAGLSPSAPDVAPRRVADATNASRSTQLGNPGFNTKETAAA